MKPKALHISIHSDFKEAVVFHRLDAVSFRDSRRRKQYGMLIKETLGKIYCENWPYTTPLMIAIGISGPPKQYKRRDLDNMTKVILDAGNGIIYSDDRPIEILLVQKQIWPQSEHGFMVATRPLTRGKKDRYSPQIIRSHKKPGSDPNTTQPVIFAAHMVKEQPVLQHYRGPQP